MLGARVQLDEDPRRPSFAAAREALLLTQAERTVAGYTEGARGKMRDLVRAGNDRADLADDALDGHVASAVTLYQQAALFYMAAFVTVRSGASPTEPLRADDVLSRFQALEPPRAPPCGPAALASFVAGVREADPLAVDRLVAARALEVGREAAAIVRWLGALVDTRGVREIRFARRLRVGTVGAALVALLAWGVAGRLESTNVALHKPVTTSGVHPDAVSPPSGLTDGVISGAPYGVHTKVAPSAWVQIDLLGVYVLDKVKVYNRGDGWFDDGLPLTLQLSMNGTDFVDVGTRSTAFGQTKPWVVDTKHRAARYVRVAAAHGMYVALSELEAFGKPR